MANPEQAHYTPDSISDKMITGSGNDYSRGADFRKTERRLESTRMPGLKYMDGEGADLGRAEKAPYPSAELANIQKRRDDEELVRIGEREAEIADKNILGRALASRELGKLIARRETIDPNGTFAETNARFVENNLDLLTANAKAEAARRDIEINEGDKAA